MSQPDYDENSCMSPLEFAERGYHIFPCAGKKPLVLWKEKSTTDPNVIQKWIEMHPDCNWGLDCGKSGVFVLDDDRGKNLDASRSLQALEERQGKLPHTFTVGTPSGGYHYYFSGHGNNSASTKFGPGLDTRGDGGYVVAPCSGGYTIKEDCDVAEAPQWMIDRAGKPTERPEKTLAPVIPLDQEYAIDFATKYLQEVDPAVEGGGGDAQTYRVACHVKDLGVSRDKALELMLDHWNDRCSPPWDPEDLETKVKNAYSYGKEAPGSANPEAIFSKIDDLDTPDNIQNLLDRLIILDDADLEDLPGSVVDRIVPVGEVTLLSGHGGSGKSYVALLIAILVVLGRSFGGLKTQSCGVLFVSAEDGKAVVQNRIHKICCVLGVKMSDLNGRLHILDTSDIDTTLFIDKPTPLLGKFSTLVQHLNVGMVIIDNASDTYCGDEIRRVQVRAFVRALRSKLARPTNCSVVLLAHVNKMTATRGRQAGSEDYSGSTAWHNSCRSRLALSSDSNDTLELQHQKANYGRRANTIRLTWINEVPMANGPTGIFDAFDPEVQRLFEEQERMKDEADRSAILAVIREFHKRGERVTTAMQGSTNIYHLLKACEGIPVNITRERFNKLVRALESEGLIIRKEMQDKYRKYRECFIPSPIAPIPVGDSSAGTQGSMGETIS
jgi:RecA-family ATPase